MLRTHKCNELRIENVGQKVTLCGWIHNIRNHGGIVFLDLRDHYGITQIVLEEEFDESLRKEACVLIKGSVRHRPLEAQNTHLDTGRIEVVANQVKVLGDVTSQLPFEVWSEENVSEELRLQYRFLDLRRKRLHHNIILRSNIIHDIRNRMRSLDFLEIQTPILTGSSPEGARDFLVPSRLHPGKFFALPQAPQQFKQLLMVGGFDRYFQIAPCFRDEDARSDRSPGEFYQLDMEMAFASQEDVFEITETILRGVFGEFSSHKISPESESFPKIPYQEALIRFGTDKPDLRNPLEIVDLSDIFCRSEFRVFSDKTVRAIALEGEEIVTRSFLEKMRDIALQNGADGLAWVVIDEDGDWSGPIAKFFANSTKRKVNERLSIYREATILFIADSSESRATSLSGFIRTELGHRLSLVESKVFAFCWIVDFPMYEIDLESNSIVFSHNPFSMPQGGMDALKTLDPRDVLAFQYDIVCNGIELSSGAVRNHDPEIMLEAFKIAGYSPKEMKKKFPALYRAFQFGPPPHAGIAPGIDRIVMLLLDEPNIREAIAFPMSSSGQDLLINAPNEVESRQLQDVYIRVVTNGVD
ncbi:MAG: aspartate--tRNA ligase [Gammaproteobacteria bacterium]|nr:aspartate--tRNA ligase [Gammaproteobacteria bacterium]